MAETNGFASKMLVGGSLVVTFGAIIAPIVSDLQNTKADLRSLQSQYVQAAVENARSQGRSDQQISDLRSTAVSFAESLKEFDTDIQREMRDLDRVAETKIDSLDRRLQQEIANQGRLLSDAISSNRREQEKTAEFQVSNREYISQLFERVNALMKGKQ